MKREGEGQKETKQASRGGGKTGGERRRVLSSK